MSETMSDADIQDLSSLEFSIACEWPDCDDPAAVMGRGCVDDRHIAVCDGHHQWIRELVADVDPVVPCAVCGMPMCVFDYHFDIQSL